MKPVALATDMEGEHTATFWTAHGAVDVAHRSVIHTCHAKLLQRILG
jgi:hypothetical protein